MLRAALARSRAFETGAVRIISFSQLPRTTSRTFSTTQTRWFVDPEKTVFPGSSSQESGRTPQVPTVSTSPAKPSSSSISPDSVPKTPPSPNLQQKSTPTTVSSSSSSSSTIVPTGTGTASTAPSSPPPKPRKKGRIRRFFLFLITAATVFYAGGTYYSLHNDGFHDFFTEFVPLGEETVLFFEEREFKRRFPSGSSSKPTGLYPQTSGENKVTFSGKSGLSARTADGKSKTSSKKPDQSATKDQKKSDSSAKASETEKGTASKKSTEPTQPAKRSPERAEKTTAKETKSTSSEPKNETTSPPTASAPVSATPIALISPLNVQSADDPIVQDVVKMLNDLITVVNADNASGKYSSSMEKAKEDVTKVANNLVSLRAAKAKEAEDRLKEMESQFEEGAKQFISAAQQEQKEQELRWREEYEAERERLSETYQEKLKSEIEAAEKVAEQRLQNELLEQSIKLTNEFASTLRARVESERDGRLSKLNDLASAVGELDSLTAKWNEVVDSNLKTQHLVVAVDAVRALLENADRPTPFLHELAALKEIANDDAIVNAAISSIHPTCYQRGVPTSAQLIDRFRRVAAEVRKAALLPEDAGVASHLASFFLSKVMFKKTGLAPGDDVESILSRAETLLEEGLLDEATREMNGLAGWAKVLSKDWLADCRRVLEVKQAMDVIATEARLQSLLVE